MKIFPKGIIFFFLAAFLGYFSAFYWLVSHFVVTLQRFYLTFPYLGRIMSKATTENCADRA
jgi:type II secretory pathway component PulF